MKMIIAPEAMLKEIQLGGMNEEEFFAFCIANPELNLERDAQGNILIMAPVFFESGSFESKAIIELGIWNKSTEAGEVFSSQTGFTLPNGAVRCPDAAWISKERVAALPKEEKQSFAHICPDFVIEIRSKSDVLNVLQAKMEEYISNGCRLAFLIDPVDQHAYVYKPGQPAEDIRTFNTQLSGDPVLPGFVLDLSLFLPM